MAAVIDFSGWTKATGDLPWGVQRVMRETLTLVAQEKITLVHGANYSEGKPCLVNAVAQMLTSESGGVNPIGWFPEVVDAFDHVNARLVSAGVNTQFHVVSGLAAEALLANFGELKPVPTEDDYAEAALEALRRNEAPYVEPSDAEFADYLATLEAPAPVTEQDALWDAAALGMSDSERVHNL